MTYQRVQCTGGSLDVRPCRATPRLFTRPQTVTATEGGAVVGHVAIPVDGQTNLEVPLRPSRGEICTVQFHVGAHRGARAAGPPPPRRALPPVHLQPVRIAFDVSPLSHERTGVNNYIRGSLAGLAAAAARRGRRGRGVRARPRLREGM